MTPSLFVRVPTDLAKQGRRFAEDFAVMSRHWLDAGIHDEGEVEFIRDTIRQAMECETPPDPEADPRPRRERILAWCETFATLRAEYDREHPPSRNAISAADMVISTAAERAALEKLKKCGYR